MTATLLVLFWGCALFILYAYALFPALVLLRGALLARPWTRAAIEPTVSLVIACHNEAAVVADRIANALSLDYPAEKLQVVVASDGSTDGTDRIAAGFADRGVLSLSLERVGKAAALNAAVAAATGEVLVFSDANSMFAPDAIRMLVRNLADPAVGGVAGDQRYLPGGPGGVAAGERGYWSYDRMLKLAESKAGSTISATGAIYCLRRELFAEVPEGVTDDFVTSTRVIAQGRRLVFEPEAVASEPTASSPGDEFGRKTRVITRGLYAVWVMRELLDPLRHGFYALQLLSHKVLRRLVVLPLLLLLPVSLLLMPAGWLYQLAAIAQLLCYGAALAGVGVPRYFCLVNLACLVALWNLVTGRRIKRWSPARGEAEPVPPDRLPPCSVIVPTYNRPEALTACLRSVLGQRVLPAELIVVADGALPALPLRSELEARGVRCVLHGKEVPGLTESRNAGLELVRDGEVVAFLDDDVVLEPDFLQRLLEPYVGDAELLGAGGVEILPALGAAQRLRWALGLLLLNTGFREGSVLPSGFCVNFGATPHRPAEPVEVQFLSGGVSSYRRQVFDQTRFTPGYRERAAGEDKDFSHRVARRGRLLLVPAARLWHHEAASMRPDDRRKGRMFLFGRYLFFRDHVRPVRTPLAWLWFWYAACGYLALRTLIWFFTQDRRHLARVHGVLEAMRDILGRRDD